MSMAVSKLSSLSVLHLQTPQLPTKNSPFPQLFLLPFNNPLTLSLKTQLKTTIKREEEEEKQRPNYQHCENCYSLSVVFPALAFSNTLFFNSPYNVQVIVGEDEPEEQLIGRFRREVLRAGVFQECKRRRFFESTQEKRKRKARQAAKRNRKRHPPLKKSKQVKANVSKMERQDSDDNWEFLDIDLPYC